VLTVNADALGPWVPWLIDQNAVVKVTAFLLLWGLAWLPIAIPLAITLKWHPPQPLAIAQKIPLVLSLYAIAPAILWGAIHLEASTPEQYGIQWDGGLGIALLIGLGVAVLGVVALFGVEAVLGWITWRQENFPQLLPAILPTLALGLIVAAVEEPIFRGFVLTQLQRDYGIAIAALGSSLIFALLHLVWDGKGAAPQLPGLCLMGAVLVLARQVAGGSLGLAWGLHAGWVWAISCLDTAQIITYTQRVPAWVTGIAGQPLAGALGLMLMLLTGLALAIAEALGGAPS
jgi:uncharacterized protein